MKHPKRHKRKKTENIAGNLANRLDGRVAVYIDAANLENSVRELGLTPPQHISRNINWTADKNRWRVDYEMLQKFFQENTNLVNISFYTAQFGTKTHNGFLTFLKNNGYRLITKRIKNITDRAASVKRKCKYCGTINEISVRFKCKKCTKNNIIPIERKADFDVEISTDAITWKNHYDTFVLFSGDSDFAYLIKVLKRLDKKVVIISQRGHISHELRTSKYVDYYQDVYKIKDYFLKSAHIKPKSASRRI